MVELSTDGKSAANSDICASFKMHDTVAMRCLFRDVDLTAFRNKHICLT